MNIMIPYLSKKNVYGNSLMSNVVILTQAQYLSGKVIEEGTILYVVDPNLAPFISTPQKWLTDQLRGDEHIWVHSPAVENGLPFAVPLNRLKVLEDPAEIALCKVLFE